MKRLLIAILPSCIFVPCFGQEVPVLPNTSDDSRASSSERSLLRNHGGQSAPDSAVEYLRIELVKAELEQEAFARQVGHDHPSLVVIGRRIQSLRKKLHEESQRQANTNADRFESVSPTDRATLEASRNAAEREYRMLEEASLRAAREYRAEAAQESPDAKALAALKQRLSAAVKAAFEAQSRLQAIRLRIAQQDLADVQAKHQRRQRLADKIVERRVADLMNGEDLEWQAKADKAKNANNRLTRANGEAQTDDSAAEEALPSVASNETAQADPDLDGEWKLLDITGVGIISHEENLRLRTSADEYTLLRGTHETKLGRRIGLDVTPHTIDVTRPDLPGNSLVYSGIYKVEGDTLTIAWAPSDGSAPRPIDFKGTVGTVQTWKRVETLPTFATPQELLDYIGGALDDDGETLRRYVSVLTDDEAKRFAGMMIRVISGMQAVTGLVAAFGAEGQNGDFSGPQFLEAVTKLTGTLKRHEITNPPPDAQAARQQIQMAADIAGLLTGQSGSTARMDPDNYSMLLRTAAGTLDDPRAFLEDLAPAIGGLDSNKSKKAKPQWDINIDGDTAVVVNTAHVDGDSGLVDQSESMTLVKSGDTWTISSMFSDDVTNKLQEGFQSTTSSRSSDQAGTVTSVVPSSSAPTPYPSTAEPNAVYAKRDLLPFTELTENVIDPRHVSAIVSASDSAPATLEQVRGKFINRRMKKGDLITADMLIDKPTTQQIVDFWLSEAAEGREVFESLRSRGIPAHYYNEAAEFPFSAAYAQRFNRSLPSWTAEYVAAVASRLKPTPVKDWSQAELNVLHSVAEPIHYQTVDEQHDLAGIGEQLADFIKVNADSDSASSDPEIRKAAYSSLILSLAARLNGGLPKEILEVEPIDEAIVAKLRLLEKMADNEADDRWIGQEHIRLAGLMEDAPMKALELLLTSRPFRSRELMQHWIFAMGSRPTYDAWRSSPPEQFSPPVDAVLLIAAAELLAGRDETTNHNLATVFFDDGPGNMFVRHVNDLLSSELAYRESVLQSLVSIYRKSKSEELQGCIAALAPAVPVMAGKSADETATGPAPECEIWGLPLRSVSGGHGMMVMECPVDNPLHEVGIRKGDILLGIGDWETRSADDVRFVIQKLQEANEWKTKFLLERRGVKYNLGPVDVPPIPVDESGVNESQPDE